jgi:hypothetical protein
MGRANGYDFDATMTKQRVGAVDVSGRQDSPKKSL